MALYFIEGKKNRGLRKEFTKDYDNLNIAKFEFDCSKCVSEYVTLYKRIDIENVKQIDIFINPVNV